MDSLLSSLEFGSPLDEAELTVVLMHGLGADGHDFADIAELYVKSAMPKKWRFVLPHAPEIPVTCNMGMRMPAWYDILDMEHPRSVDWDTVSKSQNDIEAILANEKAPKKILAGFSQGGAMALHTGLRNQNIIDGILVMSGYLLESEDHPCPARETGIPIGLFHGSADPVVPHSAAEHSLASLKKKGYDPGFVTYNGLEHSVAEDEVRDVFAWFSEQ